MIFGNYPPFTPPTLPPRKKNNNKNKPLKEFTNNNSVKTVISVHLVMPGK